MGRMLWRDPVRLYMTTPYDSFWYLGERLTHHTRGLGLVVPIDPPSCPFVQTPDPGARRHQFSEGESDTLLLPGEDYTTLAWNRLACDPIEVYDKDMEHQPSDFYFIVEYEDVGARCTLELPGTRTVVTDSGIDGWASKF